MSNEGEFIDQIVREGIQVLSDVSMDLEIEIPMDNHCAEEKPEVVPSSAPPLFGIETRLKKLEEMLDFECERTLTIGVVGMPGIGKTTLMSMLYEKWQDEFLRCVFLHDVRKMWKDGVMGRSIFMRELLKDDDVNQEVTDLPPESLKTLLLSKKSLVVLDNELGSQESRRLWNHKGVVGASKKRAGAGSVRGIFLDMSELKKKIPLEKCTFSGMRNLRYLKFYNSRCHRECETHCKLNFPEGLEFPLDEVRYLYWLKFPLKKLPEDFNPKNLTDLNLPYSEIEEVWDGVKDTPKLKWVDLSHSSKLYKLSVPECLGKLKALQELVLSGCSKLKTFPVPIENMKCLQILLLDGTSFTDIPPQILQFVSSKVEDLSSLRRLCLSGNNKISNLQIDISRIHQLKFLDLKYCKNLTSIPLLPPNLEILDAHGCEKLKTVASPMALLKLMEQMKLDALKREMFQNLHGSNMPELDPS
ncbi:hypothetical protein AALP_AAs64007U000700 [Arabis alpina]|uniref:NB-ARC domain-containing protein n=1 Tax=Arabis alpina TaxID=50452 RepID=A0A087FXW8_ARAAL|nr:hypothetical protein AALP_AAs64007U000700 [Arabis alpina]